MARTKGAKNKKTLAREAESRESERQALLADMRQMLAGDPSADVSGAETRLAELASIDSAHGTADNGSDDGADDEDGNAAPDPMLDKDGVSVLLDEPLSESERAASAASPVDPAMTGDLFSQAPAVSDSGVAPAEPTGEASDGGLKRPAEERVTRGRKPKDSPAETRPVASDRDRAQMALKREKAALSVGRFLDYGFDKLSDLMKAPIYTGMIQTGQLFPAGPDGKPAPQGVPFDIRFGGKEFVEARSTFTGENGRIIYATPGMAVAYNLAGQGDQALSKLEEFIVKNEETIRVVAAAVTVAAYSFTLWRSASLYAKHAQSAAYGAPAPTVSPNPGAKVTPEGP